MSASGWNSAAAHEAGTGHAGARSLDFPNEQTTAAPALSERFGLPFWLGRLYLVSGILLLFGLACSFSTSVYLRLAQGKSPYLEFFDHLFFTILGLGAVAGILLLGRAIRPARRWLSWVVPLVWAISWLLVLAVAITPLGVVVNGSRRWLDLGFVMFQPSELLKVALVLYVAQFLCWYRKGVPGSQPQAADASRLRRPAACSQADPVTAATAAAGSAAPGSSPLARAWGSGSPVSPELEATLQSAHPGTAPAAAQAAPRSFHLSRERRSVYPALPLQALFVILLSAGLTALQPDLGTTSIILAGGVITMLLATVRLKDLAMFFVILTLLVGSVFLLKPERFDYTAERIQTWLNPRAEADAEGYQLTQSRGAIAEGASGIAGLTGKGFLKSEQKMNRLPYSNLEFVFPIMVEELGFLGGAAIIVLFAWLGWVSLQLSRRCRDPFARVAIAALGFSIVLQAFVNIATTLGTFPLTGITLPFFSGGGTSLLVSMAALGLMAMLAAAETGKHAQAQGATAA